LEIPEKDVGNRGSKSITGFNQHTSHNNQYTSHNNPEIVKEQRVDGSWTNLKSTGLVLRCTLLGFKRNSWVKVLSKQINKVKWYTSVTNTPMIVESNLSKVPVCQPLSRNKLEAGVNPWFVTGFSDAESSFSILIQANSKYTTGWRIKPIFAIGLHKKDFELLENLQFYLGVGKIHTHGKDSLQFRVDSLKELQVIINHFVRSKLPTRNC
jgi:hypothetical protein